MRIVSALGLGFLSGIIATVLMFTVNEAMRGPTTPAAGVGNARLVMDTRSLGLMVTAAFTDPEMAFPVLAEVEVRSEGTISISFGVTASETGPHGWLVIDPEIRESALVIVVADAEMEGTPPESVAATVQMELRNKLASLAGGQDYTLISIGTTGNVLTLEILV